MIRAPIEVLLCITHDHVLVQSLNGFRIETTYMSLYRQHS